ncbi:MAG: pilus assembly FimT family protein [Planctomycetota bacterium]
MTHTKIKYKGHLYIELMVVMALIGFIMTCLAISMSAFQRFNHYQLARQKCIAAAQAQIESITLSDSEVEPELFGSLWPKISVSIEKLPGNGQWKGLHLIKVTANTRSAYQDVEIELSRYIVSKGQNK